MNLYTYCSNNPIIYFDPTGHWQEGDSIYSPKAQAQILEATREYMNAKNNKDTVAMDKAQRKAKDARDNIIYKATSLTQRNLREEISYIINSKYISKSSIRDINKSDLGFIAKKSTNKLEQLKQDELLENINYARVNSKIGPDTPVMRALNSKEKTSIIRSNNYQYMPVVSTINNAKIVLTGSDLDGYIKNEGEQFEAYKNVLIDGSLTLIGYSLAKYGTSTFNQSLKYGDDVIEGAGSKAVADSRKFSEYIFKDGAAPGKDVVYKNLGYSTKDSQLLTKIYQEQATAKYASGNYTLGKLDKFGQRINIEIELKGIGGATGKTSYINSGWMIKPDGSISLNTPFSGFTK